MPVLRCVQVHMAGSDLEAEARSLVSELGAADDEDEIVLRGASRHVRRLERVATRGRSGCRAVRLAADGSYLITGGLGGLGTLLATWCADRGASSLILVGRSAPGAQAEAAIADLRARGVDVGVHRLDIAEPEQVAALFAEIDRRGQRLRGVFHLAGVLDDATLLTQDAQRLSRALRPKVVGARLLHEHTQHRPLDYFVMFSAGAALLGTAGQANYAAANSYLDVLALERRRMALPGLSINWGIWDEVGLAWSDPQRGERLQAEGLFPIAPARGLEALELALSGLASHVAILPVRFGRWLACHPEVARSSLFKDLVDAVQPAQDTEEAVLDRLRGIVDAREKREALSAWVEGQLARVLRRDPQSMQRHQNFSAMGVDSLMALEFRNRLERSLGIRLAPTIVFNHPNLDALASFLETKLELSPRGRTSVAPGGNRPAEQSRPQLSEPEGRALLGALSRLKQLSPTA
jgi:acyl carrier protein